MRQGHREHMEIFGIFLAVPVAFLLTLAYSNFLANVVAERASVSAALLTSSWVVMGLFAVEVVLLFTWGPARCRAFLGVGFEVFHVLLFFLATPAVAALLVLRRHGQEPGNPYAAAAVCALFAFLHLLMQYGVMEALHGVDG